MVAPVGDPDWVGLRGDKALVLDGKTPCSAARLFLRAQSGDAATSIGSTRRSRRPSCMPLRRLIANARISTARTCSRAGSPAPGARDSGWLNRALSAHGKRWPRRSARQPRSRLCRRPGDAAGGARQRADHVLGAADAPARRRGYPDAPARALPPHRSEARARARRAPRHPLAAAGQRRRHRDAAGWRARIGGHGARAQVLRRCRRRRREIPGAARWPACRRARLRRLGHPHQ